MRVFQGEEKKSEKAGRGVESKGPPESGVVTRGCGKNSAQLQPTVFGLYAGEVYTRNALRRTSARAIAQGSSPLSRPRAVATAPDCTPAAALPFLTPPRHSRIFPPLHL